MSLAFVRGIHRWPVDSPHKRPVTWKMFPFDEAIMVGQRAKSVNIPKGSENGAYLPTLPDMASVVWKVNRQVALSQSQMSAL